MWWAECVWNDSETSFFLLCFCNWFSYEDHQQQQQVLLLLLPIPTNFMSSLCSFFQQSSLLSMSKIRTLVSSSSSSSSCYIDCVLLSCIHSKENFILFLGGNLLVSKAYWMWTRFKLIHVCGERGDWFTLGECLFNSITCKTQFNMKLGGVL